MKTVIIPFSGGCFSGKTTAMHTTAEELRKQGKTVMLLDEPIRNLKIKSIDELRANPSEYLAMQLDITPARILTEFALQKSNSNADFIFIDRAVADSIFYPQFYINPNALSTDELIKYRNLLNYLYSCANIFYKEIYSHVVIFKPLNQLCFDNIFRPANIDILKFIEYEVIYNISLAYVKSHSIINMNESNEQQRLLNIITDIYYANNKG